MKICWPFLFRMFRYTSRSNVILFILCAGMLVFTWNRCQLGQLDSRTIPEAESNLGVPHIHERNWDNQSEAVEQDSSNEEEKNDGNLNDDGNHEENEKDNSENEQGNARPKSSPYKNIEVVINGDTQIQGHVGKKDVYLPFSFIKRYFEIEGKMVQDSFGKKFHVQHTNYEYFVPKTDKYDPHGSFLWFVNYNVEGRARVKCISGLHEVPISTQWVPTGYYYPIQIAQYGLSHYSMMTEGPQGIVKVFDDCETPSNQEWTAEGKGTYMKNVWNYEGKSRVMEFDTNDSPENSLTLPLGSSSKAYVLSFDVLFKSPGRISIELEVDDTKTFTLVYDTSETLMQISKQTVTYGIGLTHQWQRITRNLRVDMNKAFGEKGKGRKNAKKRNKMRISEIETLTIFGKGYIDNVTLMENGHKAAFLSSAHWLLENQDEKGGWPIPVKRKIKAGAELEPGWYSAMAQGQAMSVLTRAYYLTKQRKFLNAAKDAMKLFRVKSQDNGILAIFMNKFKWYEEYPMKQSLFVLNGFLYSLMGLYDLKMTLPPEEREDAVKLFTDGMTSLRAMLLMFDNGSGTIYDLRHLTMDVEPNLARWDYHATHVNQLTWITMIDKDPFYKKVLKRWQGYFKGIKAKHN